MTRPVIFKPAAVAEMLQAHDWYEQREAGLGDEFLRCVDACIALLQRNPEAYPVMHKQVRMALVRRFPYLVFYTPEANQITVFLIFHAARDPRMWKRLV